MTVAEEPTVDEATVVAYFEQLSNWGRWGADDRDGTLNLLTPEVVRRAAGLVRDGATVGLAHPLAPRPTSEYASEYLHMMTTSGRDLAGDGLEFVADWIVLGLHGRVNTHLDGHAHAFWNGATYNGLKAEEWTAAGSAAGGVEPWFRGVLGRGLLVDVPAARGVGSMSAGQRVTVAELESWFARHDLAPEPGDILCVRTGTDTWKGAEASGYPGLDASTLPWLREHDVAVLVSDATHDPSPSPYTAVETPIHAVGLTAIGMWLIDNADLRRLASECHRLGRFEFCLSIAPMAIKRGTGAPVTPFAIF